MNLSELNKLFDKPIYSVIEYNDYLLVGLDEDENIDDSPFYLVKDGKIEKELYPYESETLDILSKGKVLYSLDV